MVNPVIPRGFDFGVAHAHLSKRDKKLAKWMQRIGPIERDFTVRFDPVDALARAILYQQLSGKAAATIVGRIEKLMPRAGKITAKGIDAASDEALRAAGASRNKIAALRDLAAKSREGIVPTPAQLVHRFDDLPAPLALQEFGERWVPFRTLASFYLWKIVEAANPPKNDAKTARRSQD